MIPRTFPDHASAERRGRFFDGEGRQPTLGAVLTHDEVAQRLGISRQRVVQLERLALSKLRRSRILEELSR